MSGATPRADTSSDSEGRACVGDGPPPPLPAPIEDRPYPEWRGRLDRDVACLDGAEATEQMILVERRRGLYAIGAFRVGPERVSSSRFPITPMLRCAGNFSRAQLLDESRLAGYLTRVICTSGGLWRAALAPWGEWWKRWTTP